MLKNHRLDRILLREGCVIPKKEAICPKVTRWKMLGDVYKRQVLATMNCLTHGCTQVMVERFDPLIVLASIHKERCTAL